MDQVGNVGTFAFILHFFHAFQAANQVLVQGIAPPGCPCHPGVQACHSVKIAKALVNLGSFLPGRNRLFVFRLRIQC